MYGTSDGRTSVGALFVELCINDACTQDHHEDMGYALADHCRCKREIDGQRQRGNHTPPGGEGGSSTPPGEDRES